MVGNAPDDDAERQRRIAQVTLWITALMAVGAFAAFTYDLVRSVDRSIAHCETAIAENRKRLAAIDDEWKPRIVDMDGRLRGLAADAGARTESFTDKDGAAHERRIDALERGAEAVRHLESSLQDLRAELRSITGYYQRQVLPLLEQSNSLQMQRNRGMR